MERKTVAKPDEESAVGAAPEDARAGLPTAVQQEVVVEKVPQTQVMKGNTKAFSQARLIEAAELLTGYQPWEVAGALHEHKDKHLTIAEAKDAVKDWLKKPVEGQEV